ncbi:hypothetical protein GQ457_01G033900 [Hibiscus cannabinus]
MNMMAPSGSSSSGPAPHEHEPGAPEPEQPLLSDEIRLQELGDRLRINCLGKAMSLGEQEDIVETQLLIEKKIEQALLSDGYSKQALIEKRHQIRGFVFYPRGTPVSGSKYTKYLEDIEMFGTHRSLPYSRIIRAIQNMDLPLYCSYKKSSTDLI